MRSKRGLAAIAAAYQAAAVIPHCPECRKPCCRLETLVLELDWARLKGLWGVEGPRREFDQRLARGEGPSEIRAQDGRYYAFQRVCPAYDEADRTCRVYDQPLKPPGCTDFPVYEEDGILVADLRCEAVNLSALEALLRESLGPGFAVKRTVNREFPFLVSLSAPPRRSARGRARRA